MVPVLLYDLKSEAVQLDSSERVFVLWRQQCLKPSVLHHRKKINKETIVATITKLGTKISTNKIINYLRK